MWYRSYRDHVIMAFPSFDTATGLWAPQANISWIDGKFRKSEFVRFPGRVLTESDAVTAALSASDAWIDRRLRETGRLPKVPTVALPHSSANASTVLRSHPVKPLRDIKAPRRAPGILTYAQFKALMEKSGCAGSERSLQKSYSALVRLQRQNHCSWAQIKSRMAHARDISTADWPEALKNKRGRLPLTLQDWRRVI